jgi:hypothetical protein
MNLKLILSTLSLLSISALFMDGAIAQPSGGCLEYTGVNLRLPLVSVRLSEQGSALVEVKTNTEGNVRECRIVKSGGSVLTDRASCEWVKDHWRSLKRCPEL